LSFFGPLTGSLTDDGLEGLLAKQFTIKSEFMSYLVTTPETTVVWEQRLLFLIILLVAYVWIAYPLLLAVLRRLGTRPVARHEPMEMPFVSVIVPVHDEERRIAAKLQDCLDLDYPPHLLEILVVSDNSNDGTEALVEEFARRDSRISLLRTEGRAGKSGAQNLAAGQARGEILFLTDANTRTGTDTLRALVQNFSDPHVGLVSATVYFGQPVDAVSRGQGLYWRYEYFLRQAESDLGTLATAAGPAMALRRSLFQPIPPIYGDDCVLPLDVRLSGWRVLNDSSVIVFDTSPHTIDGELRARVRMTSRNWTGTLSRPALLNPFRFPMTALGLVSHKLLRWLTPFLLAVAFALNTVLLFHEHWAGLWLIQVLFYSSALIGWLFARKDRPGGVFAYPFSFCLANVGFLLGILKALRNQKITAY
jgi:cellulose synthase/poly-beta-1,6-N-acetylglucosamine synthase-like glycosyltransferase